MEIYLVGGAVRDGLLGLAVVERDWVVVGSSPQEMLALGYRQVGKDFPVFLHPETSDEYALARTERKTGPGHRGFVVHAGPEVTLEDDLIRRDLTINAIAQRADGTLIDPFQGQLDLERRLLRHVSAAFSEDPLRVFRVARFAAQLPDFAVAPETVEIVRDMVGSHMLDELPGERVWNELAKALRSAAPDRFFSVLKKASAFAPWFVELESSVKTVPLALPELAQRYAALVSGLDAVDCEALSSRLKPPGSVQRLARWVVGYGSVLASWQTQTAGQVYRALSAARAFKPDGDLALFLPVVESVYQIDLAQMRLLVDQWSNVVSVKSLQEQGLTGGQIGAALDAARIAAIAAAQS